MSCYTYRSSLLKLIISYIISELLYISQFIIKLLYHLQSVTCYTYRSSVLKLIISYIISELLYISQFINKLLYHLQSVTCYTYRSSLLNKLYHLPSVTCYTYRSSLLKLIISSTVSDLLYISQIIIKTNYIIYRQ